MKTMHSKLWLVVLAGAMVACVEAPDPTPCDADAVWASNPNTGACEWVSPCEQDWAPCPSQAECASLSLDQCELAPHCQLLAAPCVCDADEWMPVCYCEQSFVCQDRPISICEGLDEPSCMRTPECEPSYGWIDGESNGMRPDDGFAPCFDERCMPPSSWGFLGCTTSSPKSCYDLGDAASCSQDPSCQWIDFGKTEPCFCDEFGCSCSGADPITEGYCEPRPSASCFDLYDERSCWSAPGCEWIYSGGEPWPVPDPICECEGEVCNCLAPAPPYPSGFCQASQPLDCSNVYDEHSCWSAAGCEWIYDGGGAMPEPICECDPSGDCFCWGQDLPWYPGGTCQSVRPQSCYDLYDPSSCWNTPACEWIDNGRRPAPEPICDCDPSGECFCYTEPAEPWGYCQPIQKQSCYDMYDQGSCWSMPGCEWYDYGMEEYPCDCDPSVPDCRCAGLMPPSGGFCQPSVQSCEQLFDAYTCQATPGCGWSDEGGAVPQPCWCDPNGMCYCDEPMPMPGYCFTLPQSKCYDAFDQYSCSSDPACVWIDHGYEMPCECTPGQPCDCDWIGYGYCMPAAERGCYDVFDSGACMQQGCAWQADAYSPYGGYCQYPGDQCYNHADVQSCASDPLCGWFEQGQEPCVCDPDGNCDCDAPVDCWGAWLDESGMCRAPNDGVYPLECCETTVGYCGPVAP